MRLSRKLEDNENSGGKLKDNGGETLKSRLSA